MKATEEQKAILERVVVNAMRVISDPKTAPEVAGYLESGQSSGEGFSNALTFVLSKVAKGLLAKGVEITPEILMSENGGASQTAQLIVAMIEAKGGDITPNEIQKGIEISLHNFGKMLNDGAQQQAQPAPQQQPQGMLAGAIQGGAQ